MREWQVGELARRTGLTVRTLHHYHAIGLLSPSRRSAAGYRLYGEADVARLHRIISLRQLGLSLEQVAESLSLPGSSIGQVLRLQVERLRERMEAERRLCERLDSIVRRIEQANGRSGTNGAAGAEGVSADELLQAIEATIMFEKHYTPEQRAQLEKRGEELGEETIKAAEQEWPRLIAQVKDCMARNVDPTSAELRPLALRWQELVHQFTAGDAGLAQSVKKVYQNEPSARERTGLDGAVFEYIGKAMAANGGW